MKIKGKNEISNNKIKLPKKEKKKKRTQLIYFILPTLYTFAFHALPIVYVTEKFCEKVHGTYFYTYEKFDIEQLATEKKKKKKKEKKEEEEEEEEERTRDGNDKIQFPHRIEFIVVPRFSSHRPSCSACLPYVTGF